MRCFVHVAALELLVALGGCASRPRVVHAAAPQALGAAPAPARDRESKRAMPTHPPTYELHDDDARARIGRSITEALAPDLEVTAIEVDVFGLPAAMSIRRDPRRDTGPFDDERARRWTRTLAEHASIFGIDDPSGFRLSMVADSMVATQSIGADGAFAGIRVVLHPHEIIIRGHFWPDVQAPTAGFDPRELVESMAGKPYSIAWHAVYRGPYCRGCGSPRPAEPEPLNAVSTERDVLIDGEIGFICEGAGRASLRHIMRARLVPESVRGLQPQGDWVYSYSVGSTDPWLTATHLFDATTGEDLSARRVLPLQPSDEHTSARGWPASICDGAPTGA